MYPGTDTKSLQLSKQDDNMVPLKMGRGEKKKIILANESTGEEI